MTLRSRYTIYQQNIAVHKNVGDNEDEKAEAENGMKAHWIIRLSTGGQRLYLPATQEVLNFISTNAVSKSSLTLRNESNNTSSKRQPITGEKVTATTTAVTKELLSTTTCTTTLEGLISKSGTLTSTGGTQTSKKARWNDKDLDGDSDSDDESVNDDNGCKWNTDSGSEAESQQLPPTQRNSATGDDNTATAPAATNRARGNDSRSGSSTSSIKNKRNLSSSKGNVKSKGTAKDNSNCNQKNKSKAADTTDAARGITAVSGGSATTQIDKGVEAKREVIQNLSENDRSYVESFLRSSVTKPSEGMNFDGRDSSEALRSCIRMKCLTAKTLGLSSEHELEVTGQELKSVFFLVSNFICEEDPDFTELATYRDNFRVKLVNRNCRSYGKEFMMSIVAYINERFFWGKGKFALETCYGYYYPMKTLLTKYQLSVGLNKYERDFLANDLKVVNHAEFKRNDQLNKPTNWTSIVKRKYEVVERQEHFTLVDYENTKDPDFGVLRSRRDEFRTLLNDNDYSVYGKEFMMLILGAVNERFLKKHQKFFYTGSKHSAYYSSLKGLSTRYVNNIKLTSAERQVVEELNLLLHYEEEKSRVKKGRVVWK